MSAYEFQFLSPEMQKQCASMRRAMDKHISFIAGTPAEINDPDNMACIRIWKPGKFNKDDVRMHAGIPYRCKQGHDSTANPGWTPDVEKALWGHYHGTTPETARPFEADSANMYQIGEYCTENGGIYLNNYADNVYAPSVLPERWTYIRATA
ncbi:MAG: hypothetical protein J6M10_10285 [Clostridia bacterium]|nr:hypothetical protein [Clostridia bacterium]